MIPTPTTFHVDQPNRTWTRSRIFHRESANQFSVRQPREEKTREANVRPKKKKKEKRKKKETTVDEKSSKAVPAEE